MVSQEAPDFTLNNLDGESVTLSQFRGKIVLLHFFGTFSAASQKQLPQMEQLYQKHKARGLVVIGITPEQNCEKVQAFAKEKGISYPIVLDAKPTFKNYKVGQIPDVCLINSEGVVSALYVGFNPCNEEKVETEIANLLAPLKNKFQSWYDSRF